MTFNIGDRVDYVVNHKKGKGTVVAIFAGYRDLPIRVLVDDDATNLTINNYVSRSGDFAGILGWNFAAHHLKLRYEGPKASVDRELDKLYAKL